MEDVVLTYGCFSCYAGIVIPISQNTMLLSLLSIGQNGPRDLKDGASQERGEDNPKGRWRS